MHQIKHMINRIWLLVLCTITPFLLLALFLQPSALAMLASSGSATGCYQCTLSPTDQTARTKLDSALLSTLTTASDDETIRFIIHLQEKNTLPTPTDVTNITTHRAQLVATLQQTAVSAQAPLLTTLDTLQQTGNITQYRSFWINNSIAVAGNRDAITQVSNNPSVTSITLDNRRQYFENPDPDSLFNLIQATTALTSSIKNWGIDKILAPAVWHGLSIDGSGVTVAIMDSGVDWQHPDLLPNYRGNLGNNTFDHAGNWYYPVNTDITVPTDTFGHGTHVAGTAVGQNGIGVAPGATWIAVGLTDESGLIFDSDIHAGFEWLLAPNGNPALAPDVVNNSWGASGVQTTFYEDIEVLQAAGIITIFSAGNNGPLGRTIGTPGSYTNTIAIGASDKLDNVAWFSSRGPSLLTDEVHPHIVAPGTQIFSSLPNNTYGIYHGTSMAAPHTVGAIALMLSANPSLTR
ncbi:MAG: S8 family serine peptidase, partial [Chloroflexi bacterium]|nr:S8 family serine peptidase [Chloroflexota bacterium]